MKKNKTLIYVLITIVVGYVAGAVIGIPGVDPTVVNGDMNSAGVVNPYGQLITAPEYMCFNKEYRKDEEAIRRTEASLNIIYSQLAQFSSIYRFAAMAAKDNAEMAVAMDSLNIVAAENSEAYAACAEALDAVHKMQAGKKVDLKKAYAAAEQAYNVINRQIAGGKEYVSSADKFIKKTDLDANVIIASARDMLANLCAVDAALAQNDSEIDYWSNTSNLLDDVCLAQK